MFDCNRAAVLNFSFLLEREERKEIKPSQTDLLHPLVSSHYIAAYYAPLLNNPIRALMSLPSNSLPYPELVPMTQPAALSIID